MNNACFGSFMDCVTTGHGWNGGLVDNALLGRFVDCVTADSGSNGGLMDGTLFVSANVGTHSSSDILRRGLAILALVRAEPLARQEENASKMIEWLFRKLRASVESTVFLSATGSWDGWMDGEARSMGTQSSCHQAGRPHTLPGSQGHNVPRRPCCSRSRTPPTTRRSFGGRMPSGSVKTVAQTNISLPKRLESTANGAPHGEPRARSGPRVLCAPWNFKGGNR